LKGALIEGTTFAVFGALLGMAAIAVAGDNTDTTVAEGGALGAVYVAPVGILLGGMSGMAVRRWVSVYRRH
jgi:hypothetical protein